MTFGTFLDSLDTPGGHIFLLFVLLLTGVAMTHLQIAKGEDVMIGTFGALLAVLRGAMSNTTRTNGNGH